MNTQVEIAVNGKPIKQYSHKGDTFVEAKIGTEYTIRIKNNSYGRKLAVVTVDGLNVITGQPHSSNAVGEGYIVQGYGSFDIKGFRKDMESVGAFKFCQSGNSYCNAKGLKGNNGVIGVRLYDEKTRPLIFGVKVPTTPAPIVSDPYPFTPVYPSGPMYRNNYHGTADTYVNCCSNDGVESDGNLKGVVRTMSFNSQAHSHSQTDSTPKFDVGTTWGKEVRDAVVSVSFDTDETSYEEHVLYYDVRKNLEKIGIQLNPVKEAVMPKAFGAFATPPKGWRG